MQSFRGSPDTLQRMREQTWGPRGEQSQTVRFLTEQVTSGLRPKDYLGEILAIRNFALARVRYVNDPLHIERIKDPERMAWEIATLGSTSADCDEIAQLIGTMGLQIGRNADFVVVGFGGPGDFSHVFARLQEPKTGQWIICDPVAGSDEGGMARRIQTHQIWPLDEHAGPPGVRAAAPAASPTAGVGNWVPTAPPYGAAPRGGPLTYDPRRPRTAAIQYFRRGAIR